MDDCKVVLITTLGDRDLVIDGRMFSNVIISKLDEKINEEDIFIRHEGHKAVLSPRRAGKYLFNNIHTYRNRLDYPILKQVIPLIREREKTRIHRIILVATDQRNAPRDKNDRDTIYFAKIITELLKMDNARMDDKHKFLETDPKTIVLDENAVDIDVMIKFWNMKLKSVILKKYDKSTIKLYVYPVAGISAVKTSLLFSAMQIFRDRCVHVYADEERRIPIISSCVADFIWSMEKEKLAYALEKFDYASAEEILRKKSEYAFYAELCAAAKYRLYFNTEKARDICNGLMQQSGMSINFLTEARKMYHELCEIEKSPLAKIRELYINARIKYQQEQYVDFLSRMSRMGEAIKRYLVEKNLNITTDKDERDSFETFAMQVSRNSELVPYLESCKTSYGAQLEWENKVNNEVLDALINYMADKGKTADGETQLDAEEVDEIRKVRDLSAKIRIFSKIRNKSIAAHGYASVSRELILEKLHKECRTNIDDFFSEIEDCIGSKYSENPYLRLNRLIIEGMEVQNYEDKGYA